MKKLNKITKPLFIITTGASYRIPDLRKRLIEMGFVDYSGSTYPIMVVEPKGTITGCHVEYLNSIGFDMHYSASCSIINVEQFFNTYEVSLIQSEISESDLRKWNVRIVSGEAQLPKVGDLVCDLKCDGTFSGLQPFVITDKEMLENLSFNGRRYILEYVTKQMTLAEVEEQLGFKIKIVNYKERK